MSDTLHIICADCKKAVWVGQAGYKAPARAYLYDGDDPREQFRAFYDEHMTHDLRFGGMDVVEKLDALGDDDE